MRLHYLQHVPFEDLANIENWAGEKGHAVTATRLYMLEGFPELAEFDWLIVMGGPMNIYEENAYPWLTREKKFISQAIEAGKIVVGVCLGAQLIADVLGGKVTCNPYKEIGWYPVTKTTDACQSLLFDALPEEFIAFHWHGDTFSLPPGASRLAESRGCQNQAFVYKDRVLGIQFHLESSESSVKKLIENCRKELIEGLYIQSEVEMMSKQAYFKEIKVYLYQLLDNLEQKLGKKTA